MKKVAQACGFVLLTLSLFISAAEATSTAPVPTTAKPAPVVNPPPLPVTAQTMEDATYCGLQAPTTAASVNPDGLADDGSVWQVGTNRWDLNQEAKYAAWIKENVDSEFMARFKIATDCADAPMVIRSIYARLNHLPVLFTDGVKSLGNDSKAWAKLPTISDWRRTNWKTAVTEDKRFLAFLGGVENVQSTQDLTESTYPVRLSDPNNPNHLSSFVHGGTILLSTTHARFVSNIDSENGRNFLPVNQLESTVPRKIRSMNPSTFDLDYPEEIGRGVVDYRWPVNCGGKWQLVKASRMPGYSLQQYAWAAYANLNAAKTAVATLTAQIDQLTAVIKPNPDHAISAIQQRMNAEADLEAAKRAIIAYGSGRPVPQRPTPDFRDYIQGLARGNPNAQPTEATFRQAVDLMQRHMQDRAKLVEDAEAKKAANPTIFVDKDLQDYDDYSTPSRDARDRATMTYFDEMASRYSNGDVDLTAFYEGLLKSAYLSVDGSRAINLFDYWRLLEINVISSDPNSDRDDRWGMKYLADLNSHLESEQQLIVQMTQRNANARAAPSGTMVTFLDGSQWPLSTVATEREGLETMLDGELKYKKTEAGWMESLANDRATALGESQLSNR